MLVRKPMTAGTRSFLLRVTQRGCVTSYLVHDLRTGECRRFATLFALQRHLSRLKRAHRLH